MTSSNDCRAILRIWQYVGQFQKNFYLDELKMFSQTVEIRKMKSNQGTIAMTNKTFFSSIHLKWG